MLMHIWSKLIIAYQEIYSCETKLINVSSFENQVHKSCPPTNLNFNVCESFWEHIYKTYDCLNEKKTFNVFHCCAA